MNRLNRVGRLRSVSFRLAFVRTGCAAQHQDCQHYGYDVVAQLLHGLELFHGESEVGVREGLVLQREVPPLAVDALETMTEHRVPEDMSVGNLLFCQIHVVGMALR